MKKNQIVAIDIGTSSIKLVQLMQTGSGISLVTAGIEHYPLEGATDEPDPQTISAALQQLWRQVQGRNIPVVLSIPRALVASRRLTDIPLEVTDEQLQQGIAERAETELPFSEEIVHDYHDTIRTDTNTSVELIGARRDAVQKYIDYLKPIGILPRALLPSAMAVGVLVDPSMEEATHTSRTWSMTIRHTALATMVVDIGAGSTDFCVIHNEALKFSRSFPIGGNQLTLRYQNEGSVNFESAERQKTINATLSSDDPGAMPAHEWAARLVGELERSIVATERELGISRESQCEILLCGGGSRIPGLADYCTEQLQIPTRLWNPYDAFKAIQAEQQDDSESIAEFADTLAVALGLGVNAFANKLVLDLLPKEEKTKVTQIEKRRRWLTIATAGGILVVGIGLGGLTWSRLQQTELNSLDEKIRINRQAETNAKRRLVKDTAIAGLLSPRVSPMDILRELSTRFSDRTKVSWKSIDISRLDEPDKTKITFNVEASSHAEISQMVGIMAQSGLFTNTKSGQVTSIERNRKQISQAQITCNLVPNASELFAKIRHSQPNQEQRESE